MLAFFACAATAGAQQYSFQYYGVDQGLTNLAVRSLFQDTKGFLWLSTESGIFRYDGARFQSYGEKDGIPSSNAAVFGEAPDGSLLVGSNAGLYRLTANQFRKVPMPGAAKVSFGAGIGSDGNGRSYIATDGGLLAMTRSGRTNQLNLELLQTPPHLGDPVAYGVLAEKNSVWWGCGLELCVAEGGKTRIFGQSLGLSPSKWKGIIRAGNGDLWVQSKSGKIAVLRRDKTAFEIPDLPVSRFGPKGLLSVDKGGRVMVPVGEGLVIQEDNHWRQIDRQSGLLGPVYAILQDREGSLWLGLSGHGLARWLGYGQWEHFNSDSGLGSDLVYEVLPMPGGAVWAGTDSGLFLGRRVGGNWNWRRQTNIGDTPVHSIRPDRQGRLWLGTEGHGAARFEIQTGRVEWFGNSRGLTADSPYTLRLDRENRIWAATLTGLFVADLKTLRFHPVKEISAVFCVAVIEAANGEIWVGTNKGLSRLAGGQWRSLTTKDGLSHNEVLSLAADNNGDIWAGYQFASEIDRIRPSGSGFTITRDAGAQNDSRGTTYFLGFDAGHRLWAGTNRGVDVRDGATWRHYDQHDGLVWDDCDLNGFAASADGTVWIGTSGGLAHFTPGDDAPWKDPPVAIFTKLTLGKTSLEPARQTVSVGYDANAFAASYSALTFVRESAVTFRYRLTPLFTEWRETRERELQFPGLPPNAYRLEVEARDGWGRWSTEPTTFSFVVRPPWWQSWWFISLLAAASLGMLAMTFRWRGRAARQRERDLVGLVDGRTMELKQVNRSLEQASSQLQEANRHLTRLSTLDGLTGIANRRMFDQTLEIEWRRARLMGTHLSLILVDIDHFKRLNDAAGHQVGDDCLKLVASELANAGRRATDLVARFGGEEFALILPGTDPFQAAQLAESARLGVEKLRIRPSNQPAGASLTISLGIASAIGDLFPSPEALVGAADGALYAAKHQGRNRIVSHAGPGCPDGSVGLDLSGISMPQPAPTRGP
jgi:diguanylate cyclase (GGDEF)-like protein